MSDRPIIEVENLGKRYRLGAGQKNERYTALRDVLAEKARSLLPRRRKQDTASADPQEFWALKDVSFTVKPGEVVGIIGRNGAGKSTLLKILSRITDPTEGRVTLRGRVASLLEVGTGFHPELTGRENIYLNGAVLGMQRAEIRRKFDEIVAFAEVDRFLDTPVKRYSSGMYVRLAFAVAAHLEPEILIVDEVLAVGDAEFQKKCLGKMHNVSQGGRTVIFVSHNMQAVELLCRRAILLKGGTIQIDAKDVKLAIGNYVSSHRAGEMQVWENTGNLWSFSYFKPLRFCIATANRQTRKGVVSNDDEFYFELEVYIEHLDSGLSIGYAIFDDCEQIVYWTYHCDTNPNDWPVLKRGLNKLRSRIPPRFLREGDYRIELAAGIYGRQWFAEPGINAPAILFSIRGGVTESPQWMGRQSVIAPILRWESVP